jgi:hypothetical protein
LKKNIDSQQSFLSEKILRIMKKIILFIFLCVLTVTVKSQKNNEGTILLIANYSGKVLLDGNELGNNEANKPFKCFASQGEHYIQVQCTINNKTVDKGEAVTIESGKQKVVKLTVEESNNDKSLQSSITVADLNFSIAGTVSVVAWNQDHPNQDYPYPTFYYAFEKGDEISIDIIMSNKNGTNSIVVSTYPAGTVKFSNKAFNELKDLKFKISERSIYRITVATNHAFDRNGFMKIRRTPEKSESINFNTNVFKAKVYKTVEVVKQEDHFINSGRNAMFQGGKSRIVIPVKLPKNTVEWYCRISSSRDSKLIEEAKTKSKLVGELSNLVMKLSGVGAIAGKATSIAVENLLQPPGSDYCDIYLLTRENIDNFEAKNDENWKYIISGTRKNIKSGNIKIDAYTNGTYYLGIKNPDSGIGISILIEVVAITMSEEYAMEQK